MACARNNLQSFGPSQARECLLVELDDAKVEAADDQKGWSTNDVEGITSQVRPAAPRYNGAHTVGKLGGGHKGSGSSGTSAKQPKRELGDRGLSIQPMDRVHKPAR